MRSTTVRLNHRSGCDLATTDGMQRAVDLTRKHRFRKAWVSLPGLMRRPFPDSCVNDSRQEHNHQRAKQRSHAMARNILAVCREVVSGGGHVCWEWPPRACGWSWLEPFRAWAEKEGHTAHSIRIDGCAVGLRTGDGNLSNGVWRILTTDPEGYRIGARCCGNHDHDLGTNESLRRPGFYPKPLVNRVVDHWSQQLRQGTAHQHADNVGVLCRPCSLGVDESLFVVDSVPVGEKPRPSDPKEIEHLKKLILQLHIRGGHAAFRNIKSLLKRRGCPSWVLKLVDEVSCDTCDELKVASTMPPVSLKEPPRVWHVVTADVVDMVDSGRRYGFVVFLDVASKLSAISMVHDTPENQKPEVSTRQTIEAFTRDWLQHRPKPRWFLSDPGGNFVSHEFQQFLSDSGITPLPAPGEAHSSHIETYVRRLRSTTAKLRTQFPQVNFSTLLWAAVAAHNNQTMVSGLSPNQWALDRAVL